MKKEIYEKPRLDLIALLSDEIIVTSPEEGDVPEGDDDDDMAANLWLGSRFSSLFSSILSPWYAHDEDGNIIFDEDGNPVLNQQKIDEDEQGWQDANDAYQKELEEQRLAQEQANQEDQQTDGDTQGSSDTQPEDTQSHGTETEGNNDADQSTEPITEPETTPDTTPEPEANSIQEAILELLNEESSNEDTGTNGFTEEDVTNSENDIQE